MARWVQYVTELFAEHKRERYTPTIIQMEATECGAASLAMILGYYGKKIPLDDLRVMCGVSRDGSSAYNVMKAAEHYGMKSECYSLEANDLDQLQMPAVIYWEGCHFLVIESAKVGEYVFLNDPAVGACKVSWATFKEKFHKLAIEAVPGKNFVKSDATPSFIEQILERALTFKTAILFTLFLTLISTFLGMIQPILTRVFVDNILSQKMWDWIGPLMGGFGLLILFTYFFTYTQAYVMLRLNLKLSLVSSASFILHLLKLPIFFFYQRFGGEVVTRIGLNTEIYSVLTGQAGQAILNIGFIFLYAFVMFQYSVPITILGIVVSILNIILLVFINESRIRAYAVLQMEQGKLSGRSIDFMGNMDAIKLVGGRNYAFNKVMGLQTDQMNSWQSIQTKDIWLLSLTSGLHEISNMGLTLIGAWQAMHGQMSVGILVSMQFLMGKFMGPIDSLVGLGSTLQTQKVNLNRVNDVLNHKVDPIYSNQKIDPSLDDVKMPAQLEMKDVTFGYAPLDDPLLTKLNLSVDPGKMLAIVGKTGSGKSTVAHLATGLFQPWNGEILFGGKPITEYTAEQVNKSLAIVSQDFFLFEGTVFDNITYWNTQVTEDQVTEALEKACILDKVLDMPGGIHAHLVEGGQNLSKGQQQRLQIARALLWKPSILILDEATSALDLKTERQVFRNIRSFNCAILIITHRMSVIKASNEVVVMENGTPIERGTPEELMVKDGPFAKMLKMQGFS